MYFALIDVIKWIAALSGGAEAEYLLRSTVCEYCITVCISVGAQGRCVPMRARWRESLAGAVIQRAQSAHHQRSAAPSQRGEIYTQRCQSSLHTHTHTHTHSIYTDSVEESAGL